MIIHIYIYIYTYYTYIQLVSREMTELSVLHPTDVHPMASPSRWVQAMPGHHHSWSCRAWRQLDAAIGV